MQTALGRDDCSELIGLSGLFMGKLAFLQVLLPKEARLPWQPQCVALADFMFFHLFLFARHFLLSSGGKCRRLGLNFLLYLCWLVCLNVNLLMFFGRRVTFSADHHACSHPLLPYYYITPSNKSKKSGEKSCQRYQDNYLELILGKTKAKELFGIGFILQIVFWK